MTMEKKIVLTIGKVNNFGNSNDITAMTLKIVF